MISNYILLLLIVYTAHSLDVLKRKEIYYPDYTIYHNLSKIKEKIQIFSKNQHIKVIPKYFSLQKRSQHFIHVTDRNIKSGRKANILISSGEHAREFFPVEYTLYIIEKLTNEKKNFLKFVNIYFIVMSNPDGRAYVEETKNYCWRGNSRGVDINRNFDWNFGGKGSSNDSTDEEFRGAKAHSEPETEIYLDIAHKIKIDFFISLHSGIRQIYIPFSDSYSKENKKVPSNIKYMVKLAKELAYATNYSYKYGQAAELNFYTADGTIFDYMAGMQKVPFSLAIELWGNGFGECFDLFNPRSNDLKREIITLEPLFWKFLNYAINWKRKERRLFTLKK